MSSGNSRLPGRIFFHKKHRALLPEDEKNHAAWLRRIALLSGKKIKQVHFYLVNDEELLGMNKKFLKHNSFTDILTFDLSSTEKIEAEIFISTDRVLANAKKFRRKKDDELRRVMVHGILHLAGFGDKTAKEKKEMRRLEELALKVFSEN